MDIALLIYERFPAKGIAGECFLLLETKGHYTLGRSSELATYDIDVQSSTLSRKQATLTFIYNAEVNIWQVFDAGVNADGKVVPYKNRCQINGVFIPRPYGHPDPVTIEPEHANRILIGGHPDMRILVLPECETTLPSNVDPFQEGPWGGEVWQKVSLKPAEEVDSSEDATRGIDLNTIDTPYLKDFVAISRATGVGLSNPKTRISTILSVVSGLLMLALLVVLLWLASFLGIGPGSRPSQDGGDQGQHP